MILNSCLLKVNGRPEGACPTRLIHRHDCLDLCSRLLIRVSGPVDEILFRNGCPKAVGAASVGSRVKWTTDRGLATEYPERWMPAANAPHPDTPARRIQATASDDNGFIGATSEVRDLERTAKTVGSGWIINFDMSICLHLHRTHFIVGGQL